ncbi:hypothetical protein U9R90_00140 [Streptomyces sp. E11-3]
MTSPKNVKYSVGVPLTLRTAILLAARVFPQPGAGGASGMAACGGSF